MSLLLALGLWGQTPPEVTFKAGVTQVRLDFRVTNSSGRPVNGLAMEDFQIFDEEAPQPALYFGHDEEPLNILMLLDVSGSMKNYLEQIAKSARGVLGSLRKEDKVGVMAFSKETDFLMPFTSSADRAANAIDQALRPQILPAGTAINVAVIDAAQAFREAAPKAGRRAIVILTDNNCLNYRVTDEQTLKALFDADTVLNAIVTKNAERPKPFRVGENRNPDFSFADVFRLSEESGGGVLRTERADEAFGRMIEQLRSSYTLAYSAPAASGASQFRRVRLELSPAAKKKFGKLKISVRTGYYTA